MIKNFVFFTHFIDLPLKQKPNKTEYKILIDAFRENHNFLFFSNEEIFSPSNSSYFLAETLLNFEKNKKILDMFSGNGFIGIVASYQNQVDLTDLSAEACQLMEVNKDFNNNLWGKVNNIIQSDLFSNITDKYDVISASPPCMTEEEFIKFKVNKDGVSINLKDSYVPPTNNKYYFYEKIIQNSSEHLNKNGKIYFYVPTNEDKQYIENYALNYGFKTINYIRKKKNKKYRETELFDIYFGVMILQKEN